MDTMPLLHRLGVDIQDSHLAEVVNVVLQLFIIVVLAGLLYYIAKKWLSLLILKIVGHTKTNWDDILYEQRFFSKLSYLIPPVAAYFVLSFIDWEYTAVVRRFVDTWVVIAVFAIFNTLLSAINKIYESYPMAKDRPIKVFIQVIKIFLYCVVVVTVISILLDKSPEHLLVGLGAFAAVLMLIFKDSILGFVAGVQLIANNMLRIGDWIVMPANNADGEVLEINLYTVKVQNWDKTISTIPTYQLVSQSFTNWRGMQESQGRRIKRSLSIDISSVHFLSHDEVEQLKVSDFLKSYIVSMQQRLSELNQDKETVLDEQKLTNIGVFRIYMSVWLEANADVNNDMTHMVRQLQPTATGIPIEVYCFSAKQEWVAYEKVQADIFDHMMAVVPQFGLKVFQYPTDIFAK